MQQWKIVRDPIYNILFKKYGYDFIKEAGFFEDDYKEHIDMPYYLRFPIIPIHNVEENYRIGKKNIILLYSGCFNPIHSGHIFSMKSSIDYINNSGYNVVNAYFTPAHESYLKLKTDKVYNILERSKFIYKKIEENNLSNICDVNVLPALLLKYDINFTEQMYFLKEYIKKYTGLDIPIYLVCGGDNSNFFKSFINETEYGCIINNRPGSKELYESSKQDYLLTYSDSKEIFFNDDSHEGSSTNIRSKENFIKPTKKDLKLRVSKEDIEDPRTEKIISVLNKYYNNVYLIHVEEQREFFDKLPQNLISLDALLYKELKFELSRYYDLFGTKFVKFGPRHSKNLLMQVSELKKQIKGDKFYLFDDDIYTGNTIKFAKEYLEKYGDIKINGCISFNINEQNNEILDLRDFLIGCSGYNGLGITTKKTSRLKMPYLLPFINVYERCSIVEYKEFSKEILEINYIYYKSTKLKILHLDTWTINFFNFVGEDENSFVKDVLMKYIVLLD